MNEKRIEIREMIPEDWGRVRDIYSQGIEEGGSTVLRECPDYDYWDAAHLKDCRFVITVDDVIAGFAVIGTTSRLKPYWGVVEVSIYFDRDFRGMGLGTQLMMHLCRATEEKGYWCLYSAVFATNEASLALHEKCGFRTVGRREKIAKDRFDQWQDTIIMERRNNNF